MDIFELTDKLNEALTLKDELADQTKANNKQIEQLKQELADQMIDNEMTSISRCGFKFTLQEKTRYSKKSEADLQAEGIDFHEALRAAGFGDLIVETVNPRSLQSSLANSNCFCVDGGTVSLCGSDVVSIMQYLISLSSRFLFMWDPP